MITITFALFPLLFSLIVFFGASISGCRDSGGEWYVPILGALAALVTYTCLYGIFSMAGWY